AIAGADIVLTGPALIGGIKITSDATGSYRASGLQAGICSLRASKPGFAIKVYQGLTVTVNTVMTLDIALDVSPVEAAVIVTGVPAQLETAISSSGATILPQQIERMPINGRNYLDLMQLAAGVTVNRRVDAGTDGATPILGERGG